VIAIFEKSQNAKIAKSKKAKSPIGKNCARKIRHREKLNRDIAALWLHGRPDDLPEDRGLLIRISTKAKRGAVFVRWTIAAESTDLALFAQGFPCNRPPR
jgi:hypothetical protein